LYCIRRLKCSPQKYGRTPLIYAAIEGRKKCVLALLEGGAEVDMSDHVSALPKFHFRSSKHFPR
jgi:ankyrin repeat protein